MAARPITRWPRPGLDPSFLSLGGAVSRGTVIGVSDGPAGSDFYSFTLNAGDTITIGVENLPGTGTDITLLNPSGIALAKGVAGSTAFDSAITDYPSVLNSGKYYIQVSGQSATNYNLVVTRNGAFDIVPNSTSATAQSIDGTDGVLGAITQPTATAILPASNADRQGDTANSFPFHLAASGLRGCAISRSTRRPDSQLAGPSTPFASAGQQLRRLLDLGSIDVQIRLGYAATTVATP